MTKILTAIAASLLITSTATANVCDERPANLLPKGASNYILSHVEVLTTDGGRLDWGSDGNIYFDRKTGIDGYEVWKLDMLTRVETCLTCGNFELFNNAGNVRGQPAIDPTATWLVIQAEHPDHATLPEPQSAQPGKGMYNDLWVIHLPTGNTSLLNRVSNGKWFNPIGGTLHPQWSNDGTRLMWGDMQGYNLLMHGLFGDWQMAMAEFHVLETVPVQPVLEYRQNFNPGVGKWMETHSWGPTDSIFIYTYATNPYVPWALASDIAYNTVEQLQEGCDPIRLTQSSGLGGEPFYYDEHAHFTRDFDAITWLSTEEIPEGEIWIMNPNGNNRRRLTGFNIPGTAEYILTGGQYDANVPSDSAWNPTPPAGKAQLAVFVQVDFQFMQNESNLDYIYLLEFDVE